MKKIFCFSLMLLVGSQLLAVNQIILSTQQVESPSMVPNYPEKLPNSQLHLISRYLGRNLQEGVRAVGSPIKSEGWQKKGLYSLSINTSDLRTRGLFSEIRGGGPHYWISKNFDDQNLIPFLDPQKSKIEFSAEVRVPVVQISYSSWIGNEVANGGVSAAEAPVTQLNFGIYFKNLKSQKTFAVLMGLYESRGPYAETRDPANDTYVQFTSSPILDSSRLIEIAPGSARMQSRPFLDFKKFKVAISSAQFQKILNIISEQSGYAIGDYKIMMAGLMFELPNYHETGNNTSLVEIKNFKVEIINP